MRVLLWSACLAALVPMLVLVLAAVIDRQRRKLTEKPPQEEKLLRPPGYSLAIRLDETLDAYLTDILWATGLCGIAGASAALTTTLLASKAPFQWTAIPGALVAGFTLAGGWATFRAFRRLREGRNIRLGLRGEQAVAEALHEVADCGFRAFHDLPGGDDWNIDHVAALAGQGRRGRIRE